MHHLSSGILAFDQQCDLYNKTYGKHGWQLLLHGRIISRINRLPGVDGGPDGIGMGTFQSERVTAYLTGANMLE